MKILDLFEAPIPRIEKNVRPMQISKRHKLLGQGLQGMAQQHSRSPNTVIKTAEIYQDNPDNDEYVQFVKLALDHQDNPFFPRIYSAKLVYNNKTDGYQLVVTMEKLIEIRGEKIKDAAKSILSQLGLKHEDVEYQTGRETARERNEQSFNWLHKWFESPANREKAAQESRNPQFKEAMTLLNPYIEKFGQDLHGGNIMARLTGSGPQLVIIDPFVSTF